MYALLITIDLKNSLLVRLMLHSNFIIQFNSIWESRTCKDYEYDMMDVSSRFCQWKNRNGQIVDVIGLR